MEPLPEPDPIPDDATDEDRARAAALADASYARVACRAAHDVGVVCSGWLDGCADLAARIPA